MKAADLDILLQGGEGIMLEYKEALSSSFAREMVALANTAGGRIVLGVRDDGMIKGIADTNELRARIQNIARNCDPPVKILLHRIDFIEKAGTGIKRIRDEARVQGCPEPLFEETGFVTATFFPNPEVRAQAGGQPAGAPELVGTKSALSQAHDGAHETEDSTASVPQVPRKHPASTPQVLAILKAAASGEKTREELQIAAEIKDREHFRKEYLEALLSAELLERTIPDKPRSPKQGYRTTAAGRSVLENSDKESHS